MQCTSLCVNPSCIVRRWETYTQLYPYWTIKLCWCNTVRQAQYFNFSLYLVMFIFSFSWVRLLKKLSWIIAKMSWYHSEAYVKSVTFTYFSIYLGLNPNLPDPMNFVPFGMIRPRKKKVCLTNSRALSMWTHFCHIALCAEPNFLLFFNCQEKNEQIWPLRQKKKKKSEPKTL